MPTIVKAKIQLAETIVSRLITISNTTKMSPTIAYPCRPMSSLSILRIFYAASTIEPTFREGLYSAVG
jgi:hypothetical protein